MIVCICIYAYYNRAILQQGCKLLFLILGTGGGGGGNNIRTSIINIATKALLSLVMMLVNKSKRASA